MPAYPPMTVAAATEQLTEWQTALQRASSGSSYSIGGRTLTRQDITEIRAEISRWHRTVLSLEAQAQGQVRPLGAQAAFEAPGRGAGGLYPDSLWQDWRT